MTRVVCILGPTAVGKTEFIDTTSRLVAQAGLKICIINADVGQLYGPLHIGTAKPDIQQATAPHYLFGTLTQPHHYDSHQYRRAVADILTHHPYDVAFIVGGTGFYHFNLLYEFPHTEKSYMLPMITPTDVATDAAADGKSNLWELLHAQDPQRADMIHPRDTYRLTRALAMLRQGVRPSSCKPVYAPIADWQLWCLSRDKNEIARRIESRCADMFAQGWLQEVAALDAAWETFLRKKNVLGYPEMYDVHAGRLSMTDALERITQKTKAYAKRQQTYIRGFMRKLEQQKEQARLHQIRLSDADVQELAHRFADRIINPERCG